MPIKLIKGLFNRSPQWRWPEQHVIELRDFEERLFNKSIPIASRTGRTDGFEVNLYKMSCTCPRWRKLRSVYAGRDVRRTCPHIHQALVDEGQFVQLTDINQLVIEYGRRFFRFHRFLDPFHQTTMVFAFNDPSHEASEETGTLVGVVAVIGADRIVAEYDLAADDWTEASAKVPVRHEPTIRQKLREVFEVK